MKKKKKRNEKDFLSLHPLRSDEIARDTYHYLGVGSDNLLPFRLNSRTNLRRKFARWIAQQSFDIGCLVLLV